MGVVSGLVREPRAQGQRLGLLPLWVSEQGLGYGCMRQASRGAVLTAHRGSLVTTQEGFPVLTCFTYSCQGCSGSGKVWAVPLKTGLAQSQGQAYFPGFAGGEGVRARPLPGLAFALSSSGTLHPQVMSIEEVERILDETQDAVEYQRVCSAGHSPAPPHCQVGTRTASHCFPGGPRARHACYLSIHLFLPQQIDELLAGNFTQEDEDAILEELNAITQVQDPGMSAPLGDGAL